MIDQRIGEKVEKNFEIKFIYLKINLNFNIFLIYSYYRILAALLKILNSINVIFYGFSIFIFKLLF